MLNISVRIIKNENCRNHGGCDWCKNNRLYRANRLEEKAKQDIETAEEE